MGAFARNVLLGAAWGGVLAGICLLVGLIRAVLFLATGGSTAALKSEDLHLLGFYVGGFIAAGGLVGALRPFMSSRLGVYGVLALGGVVVMNTIAAADKGFAAMDRVDWTAMTVIGAIFGLAGAYGFLKR